MYHVYRWLTLFLVIVYHLSLNHTRNQFNNIKPNVEERENMWSYISREEMETYEAQYKTKTMQKQLIDVRKNLLDRQFCLRKQNF